MPDPISQLSGLLSIMGGLDPYKKVSDNPDAREAMKQLSAIKLLNERLAEVEKLKSEGGIGVNTGPLIGRWQTRGTPNSTGNATAPGFISTIMGSIMPTKERAKRSELERLLTAASQYAFDVGGKTLSPTEAARTDVPNVPSMFTDEPEFQNTVKNVREKEIPKMMDQRIFTLRNMGISDEVIRKALEDATGGAK